MNSNNPQIYITWTWYLWLYKTQVLNITYLLICTPVNTWIGGLHQWFIMINQLQLWSDLSQLCSSKVITTHEYDQLQWGVSTSSLKYSIHHTVMYTANVQHLEWLVSFNGSFHLLQECCIDHFLHKQKTVVATSKSSQPRDTHTNPHQNSWWVNWVDM